MTQPDILFIILDTQRADRLGCYGNKQGLTPFIDRFAEQATVFEMALSAAQWTIPSHTSMFTGLYPTAHQVTQPNLKLSPDAPHVAELLASAGYETVGFCNNPLVGVLDNDLKRGFQTFHNYGGTFPNPYPNKDRSWLSRTKEKVAHTIRHKIAYPVQNFFTKSETAFRLSINSWFTPVWSQLGRFKGQNERSVGDVSRFLQDRERSNPEEPLFLFLNLMETHMPFVPPKKFVKQVAPELAADPAAQKVMREWNGEAYRWAAPLPEGLSDLEKEVLSAYYNAEVAYQDDYLKQLFAVLEQRQNRENTLVIIAADHGDGLGEHDFFGHSFVAYQELLHVPLLIKWPKELPAGQRVTNPVSTRRIFHTILSAAGDLPADREGVNGAEIKGLSLCEVAHGRDVEQATAFSEVYPPLTLLSAINDRDPQVADRFRCGDLRRSLVKGTHKLIHVDDQPDEFFDLSEDQLELNSVLTHNPADFQQLHQQMNRIIGTVEAQRDNLMAGVALTIEQDPDLVEHLRGLGYID